MPLLWLSITFCIGILFGSLCPEFHYWYLLFACLSIFSGYIEYNKRKTSSSLIEKTFYPLPYGFLLASILLGMARFGFSLPDLDENHLAWYNDQGNCQIIAQIIHSPENIDGLIKLNVKARHRIIIHQNLPVETNPIDGKAVVYVKTAPIWQYGDLVELHGKLETPPDDDDNFSYKEYLSQRNIYSIMRYPHIQLVERGGGDPLYRAIINLRIIFYERIKNLLPQPEAALVTGIVLGNETDIPEDVQENFRDTGTSHIIAISGFNIAILAGLFTYICNRLFRNIWKSLFSTIILIGMYTILVGSDPPVVRAAIMGCVGLFGRIIGRKQSGATSLFFVAAIMCFFNPNLLWDISFQLSFTATFGLIYLSDRLMNCFIQITTKIFSEDTARRLSQPVGEYFLFTIAAQITTLPIIVLNFHRFSINSIFANILILPAQPPIMTLGGIMAAFSLCLPGIAKLFAHLVWIPTAYTIHMVEWIADKLPAIIETGNIQIWQISLYYLGVLTIPKYWEEIYKFIQPRGLISIAGIAGLTAISVWRMVLDQPDHFMHMDIISDTNHNTAYLITTASGRSLLIDTLPGMRQMNQFLDRRLPYFNKQLDIFIVTPTSNTTPEYLMDIVETYNVNQINLAGYIKNDKKIDQVQTMLKSKHKLTFGKSNQSINIEGGSLLITEKKENQTEIFIDYGDLSIWIPGLIDDNNGVEKRAPNGEKPDIIIHNEKKNFLENDHEWLSLNSDTLILTTDSIFASQNKKFRCIDLNKTGWISIRTDGHDLWIETQRNSIK